VETLAKQAFLQSGDAGLRKAFTPDSSRYLNCSSNLIGHDHLNKPANGKRIIRQSAGGLAIRLCALQ
jgi:hypothetical protein